MSDKIAVERNKTDSTVGITKKITLKSMKLLVAWEKKEWRRSIRSFIYTNDLESKNLYGFKKQEQNINCH